MTKTISVTVPDEDHRRLNQVKGNRTWEQALYEEFGVESVEGDVNAGGR